IDKSDTSDLSESISIIVHTGTRCVRETLSRLFFKIGFENRNLKLVGEIIVLVGDKQNADEFLANIDLCGIVFLRPRHDANFSIAEKALQISIELSDFLNVHGRLQQKKMCRFRRI